jgi:hypothetical protein
MVPVSARAVLAQRTVHPIRRALVFPMALTETIRDNRLAPFALLVHFGGSYAGKTGVANSIVRRSFLCSMTLRFNFTAARTALSDA